jgi:hypothetical protein
MENEQFSRIVDEVKDWTVNSRRGECHSIKSSYVVRESDEEIRLKCSWFNHLENEITAGEARRMLSPHRREILHENILQIAIHLRSDERAAKYMISSERFIHAMQAATRVSMEAFLNAMNDAERICYVACAHPDHPRRPLVRIFVDRWISDTKKINSFPLTASSIDNHPTSMRSVIANVFANAFCEVI